MKIINTAALKKGDIVLTTSTHIESLLIKIGTLSDISHAMVCVSRTSVMDSTGEGVQARNVQKMFYPESCSIYILRLKKPIPESKVKKVINYIRSETGTPYTLGEAVLAVGKTGRGSNNQYCSRLVARAYASVGVELVKNPDFCTPADLKRSALLEAQKNPSVKISQEQIESIEQEGDATIGMRFVTESLMEKARIIKKEIKDVNDIWRMAIEKPEYDERLSIALQESGYLDYWKVEINKYPWRYDSTKIVRFYHSLPDPSILFDYCRQTLKDSEDGVFDHWKNTLEELNSLHGQYPRKTLELLCNSYLKMNFYQHVRVKSAQILLKVYANKRA